MRRALLAALLVAPSLARADTERDPCRDLVTVPFNEASQPAFPVAPAELLRMARDHLRLAAEAMQRRDFKTAIKELKKSYVLRRDTALLEGMAEVYGYCLFDRDNGVYYAKK